VSGEIRDGATITLDVYDGELVVQWENIEPSAAADEREPDVAGVA
jgi:hypothetical protein